MRLLVIFGVLSAAVASPLPAVNVAVVPTTRARNLLSGSTRPKNSPEIQSLRQAGDRRLQQKFAQSSTLVFEVGCENATSGQGVFVVGSIPELGEWEVGAALRLHTSASHKWSATLPSVPVGRIHYTFVIQREDRRGKVVWEKIPYRQIDIGQGTSTTIQALWGKRKEEALVQASGGKEGRASAGRQAQVSAPKRTEALAAEAKTDAHRVQLMRSHYLSEPPQEDSLGHDGQALSLWEEPWLQEQQPLAPHEEQEGMQLIPGLHLLPLESDLDKLHNQMRNQHPIALGSSPSQEDEMDVDAGGISRTQSLSDMFHSADETQDWRFPLENAAPASLPENRDDDETEDLMSAHSVSPAQPRPIVRERPSIIGPFAAMRTQHPIALGSSPSQEDEMDVDAGDISRTQSFSEMFHSADETQDWRFPLENAAPASRPENRGDDETEDLMSPHSEFPSEPRPIVRERPSIIGPFAA